MKIKSLFFVGLFVLFVTTIGNPVKAALDGWTNFGSTVGLNTSTDYVGIGTTNAVQKLDIIGDINVWSTGGFRINNTAVVGQYLRGNGSRFVASPILFADLPKLFTAAGWKNLGNIVALEMGSYKVGVGTSAPISKLDVAGMISTDKLNIKVANTAAASIGTAMLHPFRTSTVVYTMAVTANSHIFVTSKNNINFPLSVTSQTPGLSFTVTMAGTGVSVPVNFSWMVVDKNGFE